MTAGGQSAPQDLLPLPRAAALLLWTSAYLRGDIGPDDAPEIAHGHGHRPARPDGIDLFDWMVDVRRLPHADLRLALPVPGNVSGLIPPPAAITAALEAEQAIIVVADGLADHTLVPELADTDETGAPQVSWRRIPAPERPVPPAPTSGTGREQFLHALNRAAGSSQELDLVPEEPVPLAHLPLGWTAIDPPRHLSGPSRHLLTLTARTLLLTGDELADGSGHTVDLSGATHRTRILRELQTAARDGLVEAVAAGLREARD